MSDIFDRNESTQHPQAQCPNCGSQNTSVAGEEYVYPIALLALIKGDWRKASPANVRLQIVIYQILAILGIIGFSIDLISGTWSTNGEQITLDGHPFRFVTIMLVALFVFWLYWLSIQSQKLPHIKKATCYKCLDCTYEWRFRRLFLSPQHGAIDAEMMNSEDYIQAQLHSYRMFGQKQEKDFSALKWFIGILSAVITTLIWWRWRNHRKSE